MSSTADLDTGLCRCPLLLTWIQRIHSALLAGFGAVHNLAGIYRYRLLLTGTKWGHSDWLDLGQSKLWLEFSDIVS